MEREISITELKPDDWEVLKDLKIESLGQEPLAFEDVEEGLKKYLDRTEEEWRDNLAGIGHSGKKITLFAKEEKENKYVGMVSALINGSTATIQHMYVDNGYRGLKIGKKLLEELIAQLKKDTTINKIELQVLATQTAAINLYHSLGFKDIRTVKAKRGEVEYDEIEMELPEQ